MAILRIAAMVLVPACAADADLEADADGLALSYCNAIANTGSVAGDPWWEL